MSFQDKASKVIKHDRKETATIFFLAHRNYLKSVALRYVPFAHLADDVLQQVYVEFLANVDKWDFDGNIKVLLTIMTQNIARALWKTESRHCDRRIRQIAEHVLKVAESRGEDDADRYGEDLRALHICLSKAPEKSRELIRLRYFAGHSYKEIAEMMQLETDVLHRAFYRLKKRLRQCMEKTRKILLPSRTTEKET